MLKLTHMNQKFIIPAHAKIIDLDQVPDEMFKQRLMGDGFALELLDGEIVAPMDGVITALFPAGHAIGLLLDGNIEILIHIGIDTIKLKNKPIDIFVSVNERVKQGQLLVRVDLNKFKEGNIPPIVPIVFTRNTLFSVKRNVNEVQCGEENIIETFE
ncbi:MAG: PTS sugar transporter subunit IIA [Erysipelotrichaceae bacterium]